MGNKIRVLITGTVIGVVALILTMMGNPANMGLCIACFLRDTAGGLGLHQAAVVRYIRPEIPGIILGAFLIATFNREFRASGGANKTVRFILGFIMMIGMLVFLGCPLRVALRLGAGDLNALVGFAGLFAGVAAGTFFLKSGFSLGRSGSQPGWAGVVFPAIAVVMLALLFLKPSFIYFSQEGPGSNHAPVLISIFAGLLVGALSQRSRFCMAGGIRDLILFRNFNLIAGFLMIILVTFAGSLYLNKFQPGFAAQPIAHSEALWNFLGLAAAGWAGALLGGCPLRQLVLAGQGNTDAAVTVGGLAAGAAAAHTFGLAAGPAGVPQAGGLAVAAGLIILLALSIRVCFSSVAVERRKVNAGS